jgi:hypothetical protein
LRQPFRVSHAACLAFSAQMIAPQLRSCSRRDRHGWASITSIPTSPVSDFGDRSCACSPFRNYEWRHFADKRGHKTQVVAVFRRKLPLVGETKLLLRREPRDVVPPHKQRPPLTVFAVTLASASLRRHQRLPQFIRKESLNTPVSATTSSHEAAQRKALYKTIRGRTMKRSNKYRGEPDLRRQEISLRGKFLWKYISGACQNVAMVWGVC